MITINLNQLSKYDLWKHLGSTCLSSLSEKGASESSVTQKSYVNELIPVQITCKTMPCREVCIYIEGIMIKGILYNNSVMMLTRQLIDFLLDNEVTLAVVDETVNSIEPDGTPTQIQCRQNNGIDINRVFEKDVLACIKKSERDTVQLAS